MSFSSDVPLQSNQLPISIEFPKVNKEFDDILSLTYKRVADAVNKKEGSLYLLQELANFEQYFKYSSGTTPDPNSTRSGYRVTFDLIKLNGGAPIGAGTTNLVLTATTTPPLINGILNPVHGFGGATISGPIYLFINDPDLYVRFDNTNPAAQVVSVVNNTGSNVTQAYWVMEYLKT